MYIYIYISFRFFPNSHLHSTQLVCFIQLLFHAKTCELSLIAIAHTQDTITVFLCRDILTTHKYVPSVAFQRLRKEGEQLQKSSYNGLAPTVKEGCFWLLPVAAHQQL